MPPARRKSERRHVEQILEHGLPDRRFYPLIGDQRGLLVVTILEDLQSVTLGLITLETPRAPNEYPHLTPPLYSVAAMRRLRAIEGPVVLKVLVALEILAGVIGDRRRWRTMPWLTLLFGLLIVPLGAVSIYFIIIQPIVIGTWCSLCLLAAAAVLLQIPYSFDEILATLQFLRARHRQGVPLWYLLVHGGTIKGDGIDHSDDFAAGPAHVVSEMVHGGVTFPWTLVLSAVIGAALMLTRVLLDASGAAADNDHLVGSLVVTFSIMALAEVARPLRFVNVVLGLWLVLTPWLVSDYAGASSVASVVAGALLIVLATPRGSIRNHYAGWDRWIGIRSQDAR